MAAEILIRDAAAACDMLTNRSAIRSWLGGVAAGLCCVALSFICSGTARSQCPGDTLLCAGYGCSGIPTYSTSSSSSCQLSGSVASYNLVGGTFDATSGYDYCDRSSVIASDTYSVVGIPAGTPLSFKAILSAAASASCCCPFISLASAGATIREPATGLESNGGASCSSAPFMGPLEISLAHAAGEAFTLWFSVGASSQGGGLASAYAQLSFAGLPPGSRVVSCQGYVQDFPTAVKPTSWGRLKTVYR